MKKMQLLITTSFLIILSNNYPVTNCIEGIKNGYPIQSTKSIIKIQVKSKNISDLSK